MSRWHLYLVRTRDGSLYTGIASDVARRFGEHQAGGGKGSRYLRGRGPLKLVFHREIGSRSLALQVERRIKKLPKSEKERMVRGNPTTRVLLAQLELGTRPT